MGSISIWHWLVVLLIVVLVFGTKKLKNMGSDLGGAVKGFKDGMQDGSAPGQPCTACEPGHQQPAGGARQDDHRRRSAQQVVTRLRGGAAA